MAYCIEWVPGHTRIIDNERGDLPADKQPQSASGVNIYRLAKGEDFTTLYHGHGHKNDQRQETVLPPNPTKSFLDRAQNRLARKIAQIRTGHWVSAHWQYLKRVRKKRVEIISDQHWWCGQFRMSRTHVVLRCNHPDLENARTPIGDRPREDGRNRKRPKSLGQF
jgi:hypothetical protein